MEDYYIVLPHSPGGGGLFLGWKKDVKLTVLKSSQNYIDTKISYKRHSFQTTFVYGEPDHSKKQAMWRAGYLHPNP